MTADSISGVERTASSSDGASPRGKRVDQFTSEVASTGLLLLLGNAVPTIVLALATIVVARVLGPDSYGLYSLILLTPTYLAFAIDLGLPTSLAHFSARAYEDPDNDMAGRFASTAITTGVALGVLSTVAALLLSSFISNVVISRPGTETLVAWASVILAPQVVFNLLTQFFPSVKRSAYSAAINVIQGLVKALVQLSLVLLSYSVAGAVIGNVAGSLVASAVGIVLLVVRVKPKKLIDVDFDLLKKMLLYGLPFYICIFMYQTQIQYQGVLMGELSTDAQIGNYKTASNYMFILAMTVAPLNSTFVPAFSRYDPKKDREVLESIFREAIRYASFVTLPLAAAVIALSGDGVYALFGNEYAEAPLYLALLALHYIFSPIGANVLANSFNGLGKSYYVLAINGVWAILYMLFARPAMLWAGLPGIIVLFTASWIPAVLAGLAIAKLKFGVGIDLSWSARIYFATAVAALLTWAVVNYFPLGKGWPNLVLGGPIFFALVLTLFPLLRVLDSRDLDRLDGFLGRSGPFRPALAPFIRYERALLTISSSRQSRTGT
ncbi:MAG TPA: oligosaccharide flippase family protein [Thermoproteota archaeon]|nr:oligosaccharide flippase family protein [Thermoproteota archaeon]